MVGMKEEVGVHSVRPVSSSVVDVEAEVDGALTRIVRALSRESVRRDRGWGTRATLSDTDVWLLTFVEENDRARPTDLAVWQDVDKSTITMQLKRLLSMGLIERSPDVEDRRATNISISPKGLVVLNNVRTQSRAFLKDIMEDWTPEEREELLRSMVRLADSVEAKMRTDA